MVENSQDRLRSIVNIPDLIDRKDLEIVPTDSPHFEEKNVDYDEAMIIALEKRPDLEAVRTELKTREFNVHYARNQLLPELNLSASYWSPGISGDRLIYQDNNALTGIVIETIPGAPADALKDAFKFRYDNWTVGLTLSIPLSTALTRADFAISKANLRQARLRMQDQERQLALDLKTAIRAVETGYKRILAYSSARELAEKKLEAETEKLRVGKSTNYLLLQYQRDLADARTIELKAMVDYTLALADLDRVMGMTFEAKNITLLGMNPDRG
jgi:outer membrane protein TolC